jgi:recombination protein RecA
LGIEDLLARLDPKTAARIKTASETKVEYLPLASYGATRALGGGIVKGRISLFYGNYSSGKSTLFLQSIGEWQKSGYTCAWVDAEGTFDKDFAKSVGVNTEELILIQERSFGKITNGVTPLLRAGVDVLVIDSISMAVPATFVNDDGSIKDFDDTKQLGAHAKACTMMVNSIHHENKETAVVLLSQTTTEIGQNYARQIPHGGKKVQFASTQMVLLQSSGNEKEQIVDEVQHGDVILKEPVGRRVKLYVDKNKAGPQSRRCEYDLFYAGDFIGIDNVGEVVDEAISYGIIKQAKAWFSMDEQKWQGRKKVVTHFRENQQALDSLKQEISALLNGGDIDGN